MAMANSSSGPNAPPAPIKAAIEKSIQYILKNGPSFEEKLRTNDTTGQFGFLSPDSPHHAYYKWLLNSSQKQNGPQVVDRGATVKDLPKSLKPPRELLFLTDLPPVSSHDLEVIRATALYVASNSEKHLQAFYRHMEKKGRRNQFAFINKSHTLNQVLHAYIKQYTAILEKTRNTESAGSQNINDLIFTSEEDLFKIAYRRAAHEKGAKRESKQVEADIKRKQVHFASIDWQDFSFAAKINFDSIDQVSELPEPLSRDGVIYRSLETKSKDLQLELSEPVSEVNEDPIKSESERIEPIHSARGLENESIEAEKTPKVIKGMKIRAAGESRLKRRATSNTNSEHGKIQCPITGLLIPESQFDNHLKVLLRDPRYKKEQENYIKKNFTYASNITTDQVYENIKRLVRKRANPEEDNKETENKRIDIGPAREE